MNKPLKLTALIACAAVFAVAAAASGQAKVKKMMEAAPPPVFCPLIEKPVCGETHGVRTTYHNACFAEKNGAKILYNGACRVYHVHHKAMKKKAMPAKKMEMKKKEMKKEMKK
jgi:hypothetical protein